jgi:hypothetical protein
MKLNENRIIDKVNNILSLTCGFEFKDNVCIVRFSTIKDEEYTYSTTMEQILILSNEFMDPNMILLSGSYEVMLIIRINNKLYYDNDI